MPNTAAPTSLPYPALTDAPNGPAQLQALADRLHTFLTTSESLPLSNLTAAAGWSINTAETTLRRSGPMVYLSLTIVYTAATAIGSGTNNNIADTTVATLAAGVRPVGFECQFAFRVLGDAFGTGAVTTGGAIVLTEMISNTDIATNQVVRLSAVFPSA